MKKSFFTLLFVAVCVGQSAFAARPLRKAFAVKQGDGSTVMVYRQGNGHFGFYSTTDGIALLRAANGDLCYARLTATGIEPSGLRAHDAAQRSEAEAAYVKNLDLTASKAFAFLLAKQEAEVGASRPVASRAAGSGDGLGQYGVSANGTVSSIGAPEIPVIMVEFPDRKFKDGTTVEKVSRQLNESGYADEKGTVGSVKDYFTAQSNGLFTPTFNVVAKMSASQRYAYYGANQGTSIDRNTTALVREAITAAMEQGVDFGKYVVDGKVPLVSIYYAGPGEHSSYEAGCEDYLWAHFSTVGNLTVGDIKFASFFVGNELLQKYDGTAENPIVAESFNDGIGIFVHEFGHALGLPDFYYTGSDNDLYNSLETLGYWSVMDYGQYVNDGYAPIGYNAYERSFMGWLQVEELTEAQYAELHPFGAEEGTTAYCIRSSENEQEYYLLENRQPSTWYPAWSGHGMFITHVDYDPFIWSRNVVNNDETRQRFSYVPADGRKYVQDQGKSEGFQGDLFPGRTGATEFTNETVPAAVLNTGGYLSKPVYNITETNGVISFSFLDKTLTSIAHACGDDNTGKAIYTADGRRVATGDAGRDLPSGVYILKGKTGSKKIHIK